MNTKIAKIVVGTAVFAASAGLASSAQAQVPNPTENVEKPIRIKIGTLIPFDDLGENLFTVGASYDFGKSASATPTVYSAYLDAGFGGSDNRIIGLGGSFRYYFTPVLAVTRFYGGAGLGAYFTDLGGETDTRFGGKVFLGAEFNQGFFGEVDVTFPGLDKQTGLGLSAGYRF